MYKEVATFFCKKLTTTKIILSVPIGWHSIGWHIILGSLPYNTRHLEVTAVVIWYYIIKTENKSELRHNAPETSVKVGNDISHFHWLCCGLNKDSPQKSESGLKLTLSFT